MDIIVIVVIALCVVVLSALIKKVDPSQSLLLSLTAVVIILVFVLRESAGLFGQLSSIIGTANEEYLTVLLKALGITILGQAAMAVCKDCGETAMAYAVDIATRAAVLVLSIPILTAIFNYISEILRL